VKQGYGRRKRRVRLAACLICLAAGPARSEVSVGFDAASLNELLPPLTVDEVVVPMGESHALKVLVRDLEVVGFDPAAGGEGSGHILTSLRLQVPQLGIDTHVKPRLSVGVSRRESGSSLDLRFEEARLSLPLVGSVDVAALLPPLRFPAENVFLVKGMPGDVQVRSRLAGVEMGRRVLRFDFDMETLDPGEARKPGKKG
jgi:hypothetical protein